MFLGAAYLFRFSPYIALLLIICAVVPVLLASFGFCYFALKRPEKLQSEDYQIRHESLEIIRQKGGRLVFDAAAIQAIANPRLEELPPGMEEKK